MRGRNLAIIPEHSEEGSLLEVREVFMEEGPLAKSRKIGLSAELNKGGTNWTRKKQRSQGIEANVASSSTGSRDPLGQLEATWKVEGSDSKEDRDLWCDWGSRADPSKG